MATAPIALFTYNRLRHTRQTVEALRKNELSAESVFIIFSDGPKSMADAEQVHSVREYLKTITGFKSVTIVERDQNLGLAQSIITGVGEVVNRCGRIIVLEDDLITSPYFLRFMNDALEVYEDEETVVSIHGYIYPTEGRLPETFFLKGADCLGWATWKRGWDLFEPDGRRLLEELMSRNLTRPFNFDGSYSYTGLLKDQISGKNQSWAVRWYASAFLRDKLTLYPGKSLVLHTGVDGSGTHCGQGETDDAEISTEPIAVKRIPIAENPTAREEIKKYFRSIRPTFYEMTADKIKRMLSR